jgi:hypothetical protein
VALDVHDAFVLIADLVVEGLRAGGGRRLPASSELLLNVFTKFLVTLAAGREHQGENSDWPSQEALFHFDWNLPDARQND